MFVFFLAAVGISAQKGMGFQAAVIVAFMYGLIWAACKIAVKIYTKFFKSEDDG